MSDVSAAQPTQVTYVGDGYFEVDGKKLNSNDMQFMLQEIYRDGMNSVMTEEFNITNDQAKEMQALTALMEWARTAKNNKCDSNDDTSDADTTDDQGGSGDSFSLPGYEGEHTFDGWCNQFGIKESDVDPSSSNTTWKTKWDDNISSVKDELQNVQTASEKDMLTYKQTNGYISTSVSETSYSMRDYQQDAKGIFQG